MTNPPSPQGTQQQKPSTGTAWIVWGIILIVLGAGNGIRFFFDEARGLFLGGGASFGSILFYVIVSLGLIGIGIWLLITGLEKRKRYLSR
jgi:hypothetical protein